MVSLVLTTLFLAFFCAGFCTGCLQSGGQCLGKTLLIAQVQVVFVAVDSRVGGAIFVRGLFQASLEWKDDCVSLLTVQSTAEQT